MNLQEFIQKYKNKPIDFDGIYPNQCFDLFHQYVYDVLGLTDKKMLAFPAAYQIYTDFNQPDHFEKIANTPDNAPNPGDIIVWGTSIGAYGHVAICVDATVDNFTSFDANWPTGSLPHLQSHDYTGVLGWLRPKSAVVAQPTPQPVIDDKYKFDFGEGIGVQELGAVRSIINDLKLNYSGAMAQAGDLKNQLTVTNQQFDIYRSLHPQTVPDAPKTFSNPLSQLLYAIASAIG